MSRAQALPAARSVLGGLTALGWGVVLGLVLTFLLHQGAGPLLSELPLQAIRALNQRVGPVWIAMLGVAARVAWLCARAWRSRRAGAPPTPPVRAELQNLAPVFAALGLCGTVWGLAAAFNALDANDFLARLPGLLAGLGAAMTSTLAGLSLQIATLLLAAYNPTWSWARVSRVDSELRYTLDGVGVGRGDAGLAALGASLRQRSPEALGVVFTRDIPELECAAVQRELWAQLDASLPFRREDA